MRLSGTGIPPVSQLAAVNPSSTSFKRYFDPAAARAKPLDSTWVPLDAIAPSLVSATVKAEDSRFFQHRGVDWQSIAEVLRAWVSTRRPISGASTITQQLARNLYLTPDRSLVRKLREIRLARRIERAVSKPRILELYLNVVEWGGGAWGCAAASRYYFDKTPADLDLFESTFLVSLLPAPKAGLSGRHAERSRVSHVLLVYQLLLSGLADPDVCALAVDRVFVLHGLVKAGTPLLDALSASAHTSVSPNATFLRDLVATIGVEPLPPAAMLSSQCGFEQERLALRRLRERFGASSLRQVLETGSYSQLGERAQAPQTSAG